MKEKKEGNLKLNLLKSKWEKNDKQRKNVTVEVLKKVVYSKNVENILNWYNEHRYSASFSHHTKLNFEQIGQKVECNVYRQIEVPVRTNGRGIALKN